MPSISLVSRRNHSQRQPIFELSSSSNDAISPSSSSSHSSTSHSPISYNQSYLQIQTSLNKRISPSDVQQLRREMREEFHLDKTTSGKMQTLQASLRLLTDLRDQLERTAHIEPQTLPYFILEYQAFITWLFTQIRYATYMTNLQEYFDCLKSHEWKVFSHLSEDSEYFPLISLEFALLCNEFSNFCDETTVSLTKELYTKALLALEKKKRKNANLSSTHLVYLENLLGDLQDAVYQLQHQTGFMNHEKFIE